MNIKDSYIHNGTAVLKDIKIENSILKKILAGKGANDQYLDWTTVLDLTTIKPTNAGNADTLGSYAESAFLHLTGGTMTGKINLSRNTGSILDSNHGLNFGQIVHIGADASDFGIYTTGGIYLRPNQTWGSANSNGLVITSSTITYNGNSLLHAGNYTSYVYSKSTSDGRYVLKAGDTMTGALTVPSLTVTGASTFSQAINASILGNAVTASRLQNARTISLSGSVTGSGTFDGSGNLEITTTTNHTHNYLPLSGGQMTGPLTWKDGNALPEQSSPQYFLVIDAFASGGTTKWSSILNTQKALGLKDSNGNGVYLPLAGGTMTGSITLKGLIAGQLASSSNINSISDGIWHTSTDSNTQTLSNTPTSQSSVIFKFTPYSDGSSDIRIAYLALDATGKAFIRGSRETNQPWKELLHVGNYTTYVYSKSQGDARYVMITGTQTISGNKTFSSSVSIDDLTVGNLVVNGGASFTQTINGNISGTSTGIAGYTFKSGITNTANSGWTNTSTDDKIIPTMNFIAYWNGAYNSGGSSNLTYCCKGAFGTATTHDHTDYVTTIEKSGSTITWSKGGNAQTALDFSTTFAAYNSNGYLPLNGGTLTNTGGDILTINRNTSTNYVWIKFDIQNTHVGYLGIGNSSGSNQPYFHNGTNYYEIYHKGNLSPMTTSHAANSITSDQITHWDSVYTWLTTTTADTDTTINKWKELEAFLTSITETDTLSGLLANRVAKSGDRMTGALEVPSLTVTGSSSFNNAINGSILGNAATASRLQSVRNIKISGAVTGNANFDGSNNIEISTSVNHTHSYLPLSGGTMTGAINWGTGATREILQFTTDTTWKSGLRYSWSNSTTVSLWGKHKDTAFVWNAGTDAEINGHSDTVYDFKIKRESNVVTARISGNKIWHEGNDGSTSGLDADKLDGLDSGVINGSIATFVPWPGNQTMKDEGLMPSEYGTSEYGNPDEVYLKSICKWAIAHYVNSGDVTLIGSIAPNSSGTCILHLYSSSGKDSTTLLPRYCSGTYTTLNGYIYNFGTYNYNWYYRQVSAGSVAWSGVSNKPETATRWPSWSEVTGKPESFTPATHDHDGRYLRDYHNNTDISTTETVNVTDYIHNVGDTGGSATTMTKPSGIDNAWGILHMHLHTGNYAMQLGFGGTTGKMYFRNAYNSSTFGSWITLLDSNNYTSYALKNYGNTNSRPNSTTFTLPGGTNPVSMRSGAISGANIGIFYLSDDNAFVCNSSDNGYLFAAFDTDKTADFSSANNAAFAVLSNHAGVSIKGGITADGTLNFQSCDVTIGNLVVTGGASFAQTINGSISGSAGSVAWANVSDKPATATRWPTYAEVTSKPTRLDEYITSNDLSASTYNGFGRIYTGSPFTYLHSSNVDCMTINTAYSSQWAGQLATDYRTSTIAYRAKNNGTWTDWAVMVSDKNYFEIGVVTKTAANYSLSSDPWVDAGITFPTEAGSYVLTLISGNLTATGVFSVGTSDGIKDEIALHLHGPSTYRLYARTDGNKLYLASSDSTAASRNITIKYKRLI